MIRRRDEMATQVLEQCHDGTGKLRCRHVLQADDSRVGTRFVHDDVIDPGASIGEHRHGDDEEIYFVVDGHGTMILDGESFPIGPGDVSLVRPGHSHGLINAPDAPMRLLVICTKPPAT